MNEVNQRMRQAVRPSLGFSLIVSLMCVIVSSSPSRIAVAEEVEKSPVGAERIAALIEQLDDASFHVRRRAQRELAQVGEPAIEALEVAAESSSPEVRRRALSLIDRIRTFTLYTINADADLIRLEIRRGVVTASAVARLDLPLAASGSHVEGLAMSPDGILFASAVRHAKTGCGFVSDLYRIDPSDGTSRRIGRIGRVKVDGLDFAPDGRLFGVISSEADSQVAELKQLIVIDPSTASASTTRTCLDYGDLDALAIDSLGQAILASGVSGLFQADIDTAIKPEALLTTTGFRQFLRKNDRIKGMCMLDDHVLFGVCSEECSLLIRIDRRSGSVTRLGDLGFGTRNLAGGRSR